MKAIHDKSAESEAIFASSVAILGLGLMGGSLGLALRARGFRGRIAGFARREVVRDQALRRGAVDAVYDHPVAAVRGAELVVLCVPVLTIPALAEICAPGLSEDAVVTDVGSTKAWVMRSVRAALAKYAHRFVGSHPIAGSEKQGLDAALPDLYEGAVTVVTPATDTDADAVERVQALWQGVGCRIIELSPEEHDRRLARTSHLPHVTASMLAAVAGRDGGGGCGPFCGNGFRDSTRIAEGSPEIWKDIVRTNATALLAEMDEFTRYWKAFSEALRRSDFDEVQRRLEEGRTGRRALLQSQADVNPSGDFA